jgi:hypothetical protein
MDCNLVNRRRNSELEVTWLVVVSKVNRGVWTAEGPGRPWRSRRSCQLNVRGLKRLVMRVTVTRLGYSSGEQDGPVVKSRGTARNLHKFLM